MDLKPIDIPDDRSDGTGADMAYARLREAILHGRLAPGLVVSQVQLAQNLGVSRTPLREAVRMLQQEGLVTGKTSRRVRVAELSIQDVEELYALRICNEGLGIRLTVPAMTTDDDALLDERLRQLADYAAVQDIDTWERHHRAFHTQLIRGGGKRLRTLLSELYDHAERYRRLYITSEPRAMSVGAGEHQAIVDACHARDANLAATELVRHLSRTALSSLLQLAPEHEPAMVRGTLRAVLGGSENGSRVRTLPEPSL